MIELRNNTLVFSFPEIHPNAELTLSFQRTLRIPDNDDVYPLPPGLGTFPLRHVDDYAARLPSSWKKHGGVMIPMYQAEAVWINFSAKYVGGRGDYCFVVKIATGKVNAVTGEDWQDGINRDPQDYLVVPTQPWLDGYCVERGTIRQFVAMPLGSGFTAEEQVTGRSEVGGLQIVVYPMKREVFERRFPKIGYPAAGELFDLGAVPMSCQEGSSDLDMGLAPGGKMRQEIYDDPFDFEDWDMRHRSRCFVHLANSMVWREITDTAPPTVPPTAREYRRHGLPWFDYYSDEPTVDGGGRLGKVLTSIANLGEAKGAQPLTENEAATPPNVVHVGKEQRPRTRVREW